MVTKEKVGGKTAISDGGQLLLVRGVNGALVRRRISFHAGSCLCTLPDLDSSHRKTSRFRRTTVKAFESVVARMS